MVYDSKQVVVLGGSGAMGQVIVQDLVKSDCFESIVIADLNKDSAGNLAKKCNSTKISVKHCDLLDDKALVSLLTQAFVVINSTPYMFNLKVMQAASQAKCHYIDLGGLFHMTQKQLKLTDSFASQDLTAILGMGAAPGITNLMVSYLGSKLDYVSDVNISVGAKLLGKFNGPILLPYALETILDEYCLPSMVFEDGSLKEVPSMSGEVSIDFGSPVGQATAIYTLHSELATLPLFLKPKELKNLYFRLALPAEIHDKYKFIVELGLAKDNINSSKTGDYKPRKLLVELFKLLPQNNQVIPDCEVIQTKVMGISKGKPVTLTASLIANSTPEFSAGAYDTGIPPSIVASMLKMQKIQKTGVHPPEQTIDELEFFHELGIRGLKLNLVTLELLN